MGFQKTDHQCFRFALSPQDTTITPAECNGGDLTANEHQHQASLPHTVAFKNRQSQGDTSSPIKIFVGSVFFYEILVECLQARSEIVHQIQATVNQT